MTEKIAKLIEPIQGWRGEAYLWKVTPPMEYHETELDEYGGYNDVKHDVEYVISSGVESTWDNGLPEVYIFPADEHGEVLSWGELPGSQQGTLDHEVVFRNQGYTTDWGNTHE